MLVFLPAKTALRTQPSKVITWNLSVFLVEIFGIHVLLKMTFVLGKIMELLKCKSTYLLGRESKISYQYQLKSWNHKWIFLESVRLLNRSLEAIIEFSILYIVLYFIRPVLLLVTRLRVYFIPSTINVTNEVSLSDGCSSKSSPFCVYFW